MVRLTVCEILSAVVHAPLGNFGAGASHIFHDISFCLCDRYYCPSGSTSPTQYQCPTGSTSVAGSSSTNNWYRHDLLSPRWLLVIHSFSCYVVHVLGFIILSMVDVIILLLQVSIPYFLCVSYELGY
jgi:hypothetical protein